MDEAVVEAFKGLSAEVGQVRHDISVLGDDFREHVKEDKTDIGALKDQVNEWVGQAKIICWLTGAILAAVIAHVVEHWGK